jgi:hypothetical protein
MLKHGDDGAISDRLLGCASPDKPAMEISTLTRTNADSRDEKMMDGSRHTGIDQPAVPNQ